MVVFVLFELVGMFVFFWLLFLFDVFDYYWWGGLVEEDMEVELRWVFV